MFAILGATGYIGRSLARRMAQDHEPLTLFARDPARLADETWGEHVKLACLDDFHASEFSVVINALGAGDPARVGAMGADLLDVTQAWDTRVLTTLGPQTAYVFLSSGAVYGTFKTPVDEGSTLSLPVNRLGDVPPYTLAKLAAEARHRHMPNRAILDLRVFGYADASIPLGGRFFLAELARSIASKTPFMTTPADMVRDYAGTDELAELIRCWRNAGAPNMAADLYSLAPVAKIELLEQARRRYGTQITFSDAPGLNPTGDKPLYASHFRVAESLGYRPGRTSLEIVVAMLDDVAERSDKRPPQ